MYSQLSYMFQTLQRQNPCKGLTEILFIKPPIPVPDFTTRIVTWALRELKFMYSVSLCKVI